LAPEVPRATQRQSRLFLFAKRVFDVTVCLALIPLVAVIALLLGVINPRHNPGSLFYVQVRMGRNGRPFRAYKFRSMIERAAKTRGHDDPIERDRITPFGHFMRQTRIDELPQILNVLRGEMSLIGPRPDSFAHAKVYCRTIPGYVERHAVRPGISGYAQVTQGYAEGTDATRRKTALDLEYIDRMGFVLDTKIALKTVLAVVSRHGM